MRKLIGAVFQSGSFATIEPSDAELDRREKMEAEGQ